MQWVVLLNQVPNAKVVLLSKYNGLLPDHPQGDLQVFAHKWYFQLLGIWKPIIHHPWSIEVLLIELSTKNVTFFFGQALRIYQKNLPCPKAFMKEIFVDTLGCLEG